MMINMEYIIIHNDKKYYVQLVRPGYDVLSRRIEADRDAENGERRSVKNYQTLAELALLVDNIVNLTLSDDKGGKEND